ncbi:MAG: M81 family metallopeptidase [Bacillota bacterium]
MSSRPRFIMAQISHETNTFSPIRTGLEHFASRGLFRGDEITRVFAGTRTPLGGFMEVARRAQAELVPVLSASATPSGIVRKDTYQGFKEELLDGIRAAGRIDGILLALHGAMVVEGIQDAEGDLLSAVREVTGQAVPVMCTLDYHANLSDVMVASTDALFGYDTYPHVDGYERGVECAENLLAMLAGCLRPTSAVCRPPLIPAIVCARTGWGPVVDLLSEARKYEAMEGVVNVSVYGGFPYADIHDAGMAFYATTNNRPALAQEIASRLSEKAFSLRHHFRKELVPVEEAVRRAMLATCTPVVLADVGDNTGGGASGDGTAILRALLDLKATGAAVAIITDPEVVAMASVAGPGATISTRLGGKTDDLHGEPLPVTARVRVLSDGSFVHKGPMSRGLRGNMGKTAVLVVDGVEVVVTERRLQPVDPEVFRAVGIEPLDRKILVVKSSVHYRAAYEPLAQEIIEVDGPGLSSANLGKFVFRHIRRPIFPLDPI